MLPPLMRVQPRAAARPPHSEVFGHLSADNCPSGALSDTPQTT